MILSSTLFLLAVICYSIKELQAFGKLKWIGNTYGFWGNDSHLRKYKNISPPNKLYEITAAPNNWYYRFFKIGYKERYLGSATIFVMFTDAAHLLQFFYKLLFCAAFIPLTNWWFAVLLWCLWGVVFTLCDKYLTK